MLHWMTHDVVRFAVPTVLCTPRVLVLAVRGVATKPDYAALFNNGHAANNVPESVKSRVGMQLHRQPKHPLNIIKSAIEEYFQSPTGHGPPPFKSFDDLSPVVTTKQNFDELLTPKDHVSRRPTDTFYITNDTLLRTHTR